MPAYNEQHTIREIVKKVCDTLQGIDYELLLVDDKSTDETLLIMYELQKQYGEQRIRVITKEHSGKSQTVKTGLLASKGEYAVIQDADMEYDPADVLVMLEKIEKENLDVVYGNRFGRNNEVVYYQNWLGNTLLSLFSAIITGVRANMWPRDMEVCYKMAKGELYRKLAATIESTTNFGFEPEITAKFSKVKGVKFAQVPISYYPRTVSEGKKMNAFKHGVEAFREIIYYNFFAK